MKLTNKKIRKALEIIEETTEKIAQSLKGGPGSGNFGHSGRPGKVGGSGDTYTTKAGETLNLAYRGEDKIWRLDKNGKPAPEHIQKLGIPPAWTEVYVNLNKKGNLLARGKDAKKRIQSKYSDSHSMRAAADKFGRTTELRQKREQIFKEIEDDIKKSKNVEEALVTKLIMKTGMRPGGGDTKADYKSYGATTLEGRHIIANKDGTVTIKFVPGKKKGQEITMPVKDKKFAAQLIERSKQVGANGRLFQTSTAKVRAYSKTKDGGGFKTKDHRTALGTEIAIQSIKDMPPPKNKKEYKAAIKKVSEDVSNVLGNTPSIAFKSYIDPNVWSAWRHEVEKQK